MAYAGVDHRFMACIWSRALFYGMHLVPVALLWHVSVAYHPLLWLASGTELSFMA